MTGHHRLRLHEQILLLALRNDRGTTESKAGMWRLAFGGSILAELALEERIAIEPGKKGIVQVADRTTLGDPVLDAALARIDEAKRPAPAARWVGRLATKSLRRESARGLCRRGVLRETQDRILFLFTRTCFPTVDPGPERSLVATISEAVEPGDGAVDARVASLVGVAHAAGMLRVLFDRKTLKARRRRIERLAADQVAAAATRAAVEAVQAAVMLAATAARSG
jgi:hypothetical protein